MRRTFFALGSALVLLACAACQQSHYLNGAGTGVDLNPFDPSGSSSTFTYIWATRDKSLAVSATSSGTLVVFDDILVDTLKELDPKQGFFKPQYDGIYRVIAEMAITASSFASSDFCGIAIAKSGFNEVARQTSQAAGNQCSASVDSLVPLQTGDELVIYDLTSKSGANTTTQGNSANSLNRLNIIYQGTESSSGSSSTSSSSSGSSSGSNSTSN